MTAYKKHLLVGSVALFCSCLLSSSAMAQSNPVYPKSPYGEQSGKAIVPPLDHVSVEGTPYPTRGLQVYAPSMNANRGSDDGNLARFGAPLEVDGKLLKGYGFGQGGASDFSYLELTPGAPLVSGAKPGFTVSGWFRIPVNQNGVNPIMQLRKVATGTSQCADVREAPTSLTCPAGQVITSVERAYYGQVFGQGQCFQRTTNTCSTEPTDKVKQRCLGQQNCSFNYPNFEFGDPCPNIVKHFMVNYRCGPALSTEPTNRLLYVDNSQDGKLHLEVGDGEELESASVVNDGKWHHFAIVFKGSGSTSKGAGYLTLFVDGYAEARTKGVDVGLELSLLEVGSVTADARAANSSNVRNNRLGSRTWQDEVMIYDRPLNEPEVRSLIDKTKLGISMILPPTSAQEYAADNAGYGTKSTTANTSSTYQSEFKALTAPPTGFQFGVDGSGLHHASSFTIGAWIYLESKPADGSKLFELKDAQNSSGVTLQTFYDDRVRRTGIKAIIRNTNGTTYSVDQYPFNDYFPGTKRWSFLSLTVDQATGKAITRLDGVFIGEGSTQAGTPFRDGNLIATMPSVLDLAWLALYTKALSKDELMGQRSPGPLVWLDRTVVNGRAVDWADYHDHEIDDGRRENVSLQRNPGDNPASSLLFDLQNNNSKAVAATVSAYGALDDPTFSIYAHLNSENLYLHQNKYIPVFYKHVSNANIYSKHEFQSHIMCRTFQACTLYVMAPDSAGILRSYQTAFLIPPNGPRIAMSYDGNIPRVAISGELRTLTRIDYAQPYSHTGQAAPSGAYTFRFGLFPNENAVTMINYQEARIYARPLADVELEALGRTCSQLSCGEQGQSCFETFGAYNGTATCTSCAPGSYDSLSYESQGGICDAKSQAFEECAGDTECSDGVCMRGYSSPSNPEASQKYYCATNYSSSACNTTCNALNRSCQTVYGRLLSNPNATGGGYSCGACKQYFSEPTEGDVTKIPCKWTPTGEVGDVVSSRLGCKSGVAESWLEPVFNVYSNRGPIEDKGWFLQNVWARYGNQGGYISAVNGTYNTAITRCSALDQQQCEDLNRLWSNGRCLPQCRANYRRVWSMLSPNACWKAWTNILNDGIGSPQGTTPWWDGAVGHYLWMPHHAGEGLPTKEHINYMFRYDSGAFQPSDITALENIGVGPNYMKLVLDPNLAAQFRAKYPNKSLQVARCLATDSAFRDPQFNFRTCVAKRNPNGSACPPPGEPSQGDNGDHQFCVSNFCARDSKVCEDGTNNVEKVQGENRNDNQSGKSNTKFGLFHKNQTDVTAKESAPGSRRRAYTAKSSNGAEAVFFGQSFDVFTINPSIASGQNGAASVTSSFRILGVTVATNSDPATSCTGGKWENGSWSGSGECGINIDKPTLSGGNKLCLPVAEDWIEKKSKSFTFTAGPVPITVKAAPTIDVCVSLASAISSSGEFTFGVKPAVGFGGDLRGGIGVEGPVVTAWAGIRAVLTVIEIGFPIVWVVKAQQRTNAQGSPVPDMFEILYNAKIALEMDILSGFLSIFAEVGVGPFTTEWDLKVFEWKGFTFSKTLFESTVKKVVLDFRYLLGNP